MLSYMSVLHAFRRILENVEWHLKVFFLLASTGRLWRSSCMSFRCWQMVPGWNSELGRRLRSAEQAWRLHACHQTAGLDPWNHKHIVKPGPAIIWQPKQKNTNVECREYLVQYVSHTHKNESEYFSFVRQPLRKKSFKLNLHMFQTTWSFS